jgi:hypothetical protein
MNMELAREDARTHRDLHPMLCVKIDKGVPIPKKRSREKPCSPHVAALKILKIGESIVYPAKQGEAVQRTARRASSRCVHLKPKKFTTRIRVEDGKEVVRVWRIA